MQPKNEITKTVMKPITTLVLPIDRLSSWLFEQTKIKDIVKMHEGKIRQQNIFSTVEFHFKGGLLLPFDKVVLLALITERQNGNTVVSVQRLFETLGGSNHLPQKMKEKLLASVRKLMVTFIKVECAEIATIYKSTKKRVEGMLLPCNIVSAVINGKTTDSVIELHSDSPLLQIADFKSQILRLPVNFLAKVRANENLIILNWCLMERCGKIVGSYSPSGERKKRVRKLSTSILFDTLFNQCGFTNLDKIQKSRLRESIRIIMNHSKNCGLIDGFNFVKENGEFRSIEISLKHVATEDTASQTIL